MNVTTPSGPTQPNGSTGSPLALKGLEPDNLLAFLALLGLLRALEAVRPEWRPRVAWRGVPPVAVLACDTGGLQESDVAKAVLTALPLYNQSFVHFAAKTGLIPSNRESDQKEGRLDSVDDDEQAKKKKKIPEAERVDLFRQLVERALDDYQASATKTAVPFDHRRATLDAVSALARQSVEKGDYLIEDSPLKLPSGQQAFVGLIRQLVAAGSMESERKKNVPPDEEQKISKALFSSWTYEDKGDSLRLSPQEDRRYAYRFGDPSPEGARTERGANLLAAIGLTCLPLCPGDTNNPLVAYRGQRNSGLLSWPIWQPFASLSGILALLRHPKLSARDPQLEVLKAYGVISLMRCRRYVLPSGQGDYGNVSPAIQLAG